MDPTAAIKDSRQHIVDAFVSRVKSKKFCIQKITKFSGGSKLDSFWKAYMLAAVPTDEVERVKNYTPPPPLSLRIINMENNRCCIEVRSHLGVPVQNFSIMEDGRQIFPNRLCGSGSEGYRITGNTATLNFSNSRSIFLGGNDSTFNFHLTGCGRIIAYYSINNRSDSLSKQY